MKLWWKVLPQFNFDLIFVFFSLEIYKQLLGQFSWRDRLTLVNEWMLGVCKLLLCIHRKILGIFWSPGFEVCGKWCQLLFWDVWPNSYEILSSEMKRIGITQISTPRFLNCKKGATFQKVSESLRTYWFRRYTKSLGISVMICQNWARLGLECITLVHHR